MTKFNIELIVKTLGFVSFKDMLIYSMFSLIIVLIAYIVILEMKMKNKSEEHEI